MSFLGRCVAGTLLVLSAFSPAQAQTAQSAPTDPIAHAHATGNLGPATIKIDSFATLALPQGLMFAPVDHIQSAGGRLEAAGHKGVLGAVLPTNGGSWYITVSTLETGPLTANAVAAFSKADVHNAIRTVTLKNNRDRNIAGFTSIDIGNWLEEPKAEAARGRYTTALRQFDTGPTTHDEDFASVDTYLFGRFQTIRLGLRAPMSELARQRPGYEKLVDGVQFVAGQRAADAVAGKDKPTQYLLDVLFGGRTDAEIEKDAADEEEANRRAAVSKGMDRATQIKLLFGGLLGVVALIFLVVAFRGGEQEQAVVNNRVNRISSGRR